MSNKPTHNILVVQEYGDKKSFFSKVGSAWLSEKGNITGELVNGIALTGKFVISPVKEKSENKD